MQGALLVEKLEVEHGTTNLVNCRVELVLARKLIAILVENLQDLLWFCNFYKSAKFGAVILEE